MTIQKRIKITKILLIIAFGVAFCSILVKALLILLNPDILAISPIKYIVSFIGLQLAILIGILAGGVFSITVLDIIEERIK